MNKTFFGLEKQQTLKPNIKELYVHLAYQGDVLSYGSCEACAKDTQI